jgi:UDP-N-acetylmuramoylalanine--D-glutamate ligase
LVSISCYKNKDVGILGAGLSGMAAAKILLSSKANVFIFDDKKDKPDSIKKHNWKNYNFWPWENLTTLVVSPGIPVNSTKKHNAIKLAIKNKVKIINEIDLFVETKPKARIIGITGTNGKSTTVALLFHILKFNKIKCVIGGNYGFPACEIKDPGKNGIIILELSSYQLEGTKKLNLEVASITNITPDHLDFHETFYKYKLSKLKIIKFLKTNGTFILNTNNKLLNEEVNNKVFQSKNIIKIKNNEVENYINDNDYLRGSHNKINGSIAISIAKYLNITNVKIKNAIKDFKGLPHRMEPLLISDKIKIINDSKSTNGESTAAALQTFENIFWIAGGQPKSGGIGESKKFLDKVIEVFLIGSSTNYFCGEITRSKKDLPIHNCLTLEKATQLALEKGITSNLKSFVILLSPSAASFDQFKNFEERGNKFKAIINEQLNQGLIK